MTHFDWNVRAFNCSRTSIRNASTPTRWWIWATVARFTPGVRDPLSPATRSYATVKNAESQTKPGSTGPAGRRRFRAA